MNYSIKQYVSVGFIAICLFQLRVFGQEPQNNLIPQEQNNWSFSTQIFFLTPHDADLKDIFDAYLAVQPEVQRRISKDIYLNVNVILGWGKASGDEIKIYAMPKELASIFEYKFGAGERSEFSIGGGPKISLLSLKLEEKLNGTKNTVTEDYSGLGYIIRMQYKYRITQKIALMVLGSYSGVEDKEADLNIGNTGFAVGLAF